MIFEYTINESKACRSSRLEYDERVCLTSASDGVLQSVEYRLLVRRVYWKVDSSFLERTTCYDFAIPIRSNIPASAPKNQYFALPPRPQTRPKNRHGLHYIKMFPVTKQYLIRYRTDGNRFATLIQTIIDKNSKQIVNECQRYLDLYSQGIKPLYSTDIDYLIEQLYK